VLQAETEERVRVVPGVDWAARVRGHFAILDLHGSKVAVTLVGSCLGSGGPWALVSGRPIAADDEVVLDAVLAGRHGIDVGDTVDVLGRLFQVVGLSGDTASFTGGYAFLAHAATDVLLRAPGTASAVLVGSSDPDTVRRTLADLGLTVLSRAELRAEAVALVTRIYGTLVRLMVGVAFGAGTLVIALTVYAAIAERRRAYGIAKALGATPRRLPGLALYQSLAVAVAGIVAGGALFFAQTHPSAACPRCAPATSASSSRPSSSVR